MFEHVISQIIAAAIIMRHDFHFPGHLLPGTAFIIMGIWWMWNAFKINRENDHYTENSENMLLSPDKSDYASNTPFPATYNGNATSIFCCEGFYKIAYATFDLFGHMLVVYYGGDLVDEWQHMTVYVFFILNGIIDIISRMEPYKMPHGMDYVASAVAWSAMGFLFISHTHGKTKISVFYHQEFGILAVAIGVITLMQYKYEKNAVVAIIRGASCTLAGTWLYQIAFLFHNPFVAENQYRNIKGNGASSLPIEKIVDVNMIIMVEEMEIMNAVTISTWHILLVGCVAAFVGILANRREQVGYKRIRCSCV
ncbi:transmembrane protein 45A-like [Bradysia coprophila]|uniref:transmembrane protein 45A-like n=1 Tax=Bradysia coprophila TaxID=38358 RepID=UPI00187DD074|nr:transmembrane protein 45A-like [Bradysia coprophila]